MASSVRRLFADFKPESYQLDLSLQPKSLTFSGKVVIDGNKTGRPSQRITLHQRDLRIKNVVVKHFGKKADVKEVAVDRTNCHQKFEELRIHSSEMLYPGKYQLEIEFEGKITSQLDGLYPSTFKDGSKTKTILATQFESHYARSVFPCIDEPEAKATFELGLETDAGLTTISNTDPAKTSTAKGRTKIEFEKTPIMSTYLLAFVSGELGFKEAKTQKGIKVRVFATPHNVEHTDFALETAVRCLDFFAEYFSIPYPLSKCDLIALPDFASGAMENWGCITFREHCLIYDPKHASLDSKQFIALVIAHELAHQWFGNLVTMRWWTDLWLNEGFASWIEYLACDKLFPEWQLWTQFLVNEREQALRLDALHATHPVEVPVKHPDEIRIIFDAISYNKGASVINMLHEYLGADDFREGLNYYLTTHAYANTDTVDLWAALEKVSSKPVKDFMHKWTGLPGFPILKLSSKPESRLTQKHFLLTPDKQAHEHVWPVPLLSSEDKDPALMNESSLKLADADFRLLNLRQIGFYRTVYDKPALKQIAASLTDLSTNARLGLLADNFEATKAGFSKTTDALEFLSKYQDEQDASVWDVIAGSLASVRSVMDNEDLRKLMKPYTIKLVKKQFERLGWHKKPDESHNDQLLRPTILALMAISDEPSVVTKCKQLFADMHKPADLPADERDNINAKVKKVPDIDPDLRGIVYGTVVRHGGKTEFEKLLKMHHDSVNSEERNTIAAALTGFKQPDLVKRSLDLINTDEVRTQDAMYWVAYSFANRFARNQTWEWLKTNWQWLADTFNNDLGFYRMPVYAARAYSNEEFLKKFKAFFEPLRSPAFERSIDQAVEMLTWHDAWRKRECDSLLNYFAAQV